MPTGKVRFYDAEKGFGFLTKDEGGDVYVRSNALPDGVTALKPGQKVEFGVVEGRRGEQALSLRLVVGGRTPLGTALGLVPDRVATAPAWCAVVDPIARVVLRGVRTRGTAGGDRREWYGATSVVAVTSIEGEWRGVALGALAPVTPPCRFGFSSTPERPSITRVVTTIERGRRPGD